jgi:hypothetical protein
MSNLEQAPITITLTGLLLFRFNGEQYCKVGVHRRTADHKLKIRISGNTPGVVMNLDEPQSNQNDLWIDVAAPRFEGVKKHLAGDKLDRQNPLPEQEQDFRWLIDFEGPDFYDDDLNVDEVSLTPGIHFAHGLFHTAQLLDKNKFTSVKRIEGGKPPFELYSITEKVGVNIYLDDPNSKLTLKWGETGEPFAELVKPPAGTTYTIEITNNPPENANGQPHSHFKKYFDVIKDILEPEKFDLQFTTIGGKKIPPHNHQPHDHEAVPGEASDHFVDHDVPCMSGFLGRN